MIDKLTIWQHNTAKSLPNLETLANDSDSSPSIILVQEPPFYIIGRERSFTNPQGEAIWGTPKLPQYTTFCPPQVDTSGKTRPRVLTLVKADIPLQNVLLEAPLSPSKDVLTISISTGKEKLYITNVYNPHRRHDTEEEKGAIDHLVEMRVPIEAHWLVAGDFNAHHPAWHIKDPAPTPGPRDRQIMTWAQDRELTLANTRGVATRKDWTERGVHRERSCIDLTWRSVSLEDTGIEESWAASFDSSSASDHAVICFTISLTAPPPEPPRFPTLDPDKESEWMEAFVETADAVFNLPHATKSDIDTKAEALLEAMRTATTHTHKSKSRTPPAAARWWNKECQDHKKAIHAAAGQEKDALQAKTKEIHRKAKKKAADALVEKAAPENIWQMVRWSRGARRTPIPSLKVGDTSANTPQQKAQAFKNKYFAPPDTPPAARPRNRQQHTTPGRDHHISPQELTNALRLTSNKSAPGPSGLNYRALKWVHGRYPDKLLDFLDACLTAGHHPAAWRRTKVVMLKKPNKKDPTALNAYRPITLEETLGKLLEKIIANRLQYAANEGQKLDPNQYGCRQKSSVADAARDLIANIEAHWKKKHVVSILAVDIAGFFPAVQHQDLIHELERIKTPRNELNWVKSFLTDRTVSICFDGYEGPEEKIPNVGVPQGSPISPILAAIFAAPALKAVDGPTDAEAYVDDHMLITGSPSFEENERNLVRGYQQLNSAFQRRHLQIEAVKTEGAHFTRTKDQLKKAQAATFTITIPPDRPGEEPIVIKPSNPIRWLGIYFDTKLTFDKHRELMRTKAQSALNGLTILGNTVRGLTQLHMRRLYLACILPILTWGSEVWYHGHRQKVEIKKLQALQNKACRRILGTFRTTPTGPAGVLAAILPIQEFLERKKARASIRLCTIRHKPIPTNLNATSYSREATSRLPDETELVPPYARPPWSAPKTHPNLTITTAPRLDPKAKQAYIEAHERFVQRTEHKGWILLLYTDGARTGAGTADNPHSAGAGAVWYINGYTYQESSWHLGTELHATDCEIIALLNSLRELLAKPAKFLRSMRNIHLFTDCAVAIEAIKTWKAGPNYNQVKDFHNYARTILDAHPQTRITLEWIPGHSGIHGNDSADIQASAAALYKKNSTRWPASIRYMRETTTTRALANWSHAIRLEAATKCTTAHTTLAWAPSTKPKGPMTLTKFPRSVIARAYQAMTAHGVFGQYFQRHSPRSDFRRRCTCGHLPESPKHLLLTCPRTLATRKEVWDPNESPTDLLDWFKKPGWEPLLAFLTKSRAFSADGA